MAHNYLSRISKLFNKKMDYLQINLYLDTVINSIKKEISDENLRDSFKIAKFLNDMSFFLDCNDRKSCKVDKDKISPHKVASTLKMLTLDFNLATKLDYIYSNMDSKNLDIAKSEFGQLAKLIFNLNISLHQEHKEFVTQYVQVRADLKLFDQPKKFKTLTDKFNQFEEMFKPSINEFDELNKSLQSMDKQIMQLKPQDFCVDDSYIDIAKDVYSENISKGEKFIYFDGLVTCEHSLELVANESTNMLNFV